MKTNKQKYCAPKWINPDRWKIVLIIVWTFNVTITSTIGAYNIYPSKFIAGLVGLSAFIVGIYMYVVESTVKRVME